MAEGTSGPEIQPQAIDSKPPRSASQALADELADSADVETQTRINNRAAASSGRSRQRAVSLALVCAVPVLVALLVADFFGPQMMALFDPTPSPAMARQQAQAMLDVVVADIRSFQKDYHQLPSTLVEVGLPARGQWTYVTLGPSTYRVQGTVYGQSVTFDSAAGTEKEHREP
jgi:hypothetical protein